MTKNRLLIIVDTFGHVKEHHADVTNALVQIMEYTEDILDISIIKYEMDRCGSDVRVLKDFDDENMSIEDVGKESVAITEPSGVFEFLSANLWRAEVPIVIITDSNILFPSEYLHAVRKYSGEVAAIDVSKEGSLPEVFRDEAYSILEKYNGDMYFSLATCVMKLTTIDEINRDGGNEW